MQISSFTLASMLALALTSLSMVDMQAAELTILAGGGITGPMRELGPRFERATGHKLVFVFGTTPELIKQATSGNPFDAGVVPQEVFKDAGAQAKFVAGPTTEIARVGLGVAVRAGAAKPDIGTPEALKAAFLAAKSIGISRGPSGVHLLNAMAKIGIADQVKAKMVQPDLGVRVGTLVADGKAEIGVQQIGELLPIPGILYIGPLPGELQTVIVYGMARSANATQWDAASTLVKFLTSPAVGPMLKKIGLDPA